MEDLSALAAGHGSDKWGPHRYTPHYEAHFAKFRDRPISLLEIGIGGYANPGQGGASLRMWHDYFPAARIYALDVHEKSFWISDRVSLHRGEQANAALLNDLSRTAGGFDIVVDDGSHLNSDVIASFNILFPLLNPGGLYVVEDTQTSYWPVLGGSSVAPDAPETMIGFFKGLVHGVNHAEFLRNTRAPGRFDRDILALSFCHGMVFVEKGDNSQPSNVADDDPLRAA